jgi:hypothetical protein
MANHATLETRRLQAEEEALNAKKAEVAQRQAQLSQKLDKKDQ